MPIKKPVKASFKPRSVNKWESPNSPKLIAMYRGHLSLAFLKPTQPKTTIMMQSIRFTRVIGSMSLFFLSVCSLEAGKLQFFNQLLWSILAYILVDRQDVTQERRKAILAPFIWNPIDQSPLHGHRYVRFHVYSLIP